MAYEKNREILEQLVENKTVIRHISQYRKPDGSDDQDGSKIIWNNAIEQFDLIQLWENGAPGYDDRDPLQPQPSIAFVPTEQEQVRGTVIVAHGGGFQTRTACEGVHTAHYFWKAGYNVAILTYRLNPYTRRDAMADMQRAIRVLRSRKEELGIGEKIAVMGFSAGGMLSGNCATHYDPGDPENADPVERYSSRPDACVVCYGAFSMTAFPRAFGMMPITPEQQAEDVYLSIERNLTVDTPPFFIWQTNSDDARVSMTLAWELQAVGVPFELHCFPDGIHGLALADGNNDLYMKIPHLMHWAELCAEWLENQGL